MKNDDRRNGGYRGREDRGRERRFEGPGRRVYGGGNPPRVGRVMENVPRARRVDGDERFDAGTRRDDREKPRYGQGLRSGPRGHRGDGDERFDEAPRRDFREKPHHGIAYRSGSGPKPRRMPEARPAADAAPPPAEALALEFGGETADEHILAGRNPIREALRAGRPVEKLLVAEGDLSGSGREIVKLAKDAGVIVRTVERAWLDQLYPAHQGMLAYVAAVPYTPVEDMLAAAREKGEDPFLVALDGVMDPHNLGAIIRSAECAGAHGVIIPERRSAGLSPTAAKAAAGALSHMPVARVGNLNRTLEDLKAAGLWVTGAAMDGEDAFACDLTGPIALVIGSEGDGISRLTLEKCDRVVSLPVRGHIDSLNASVAAGVLMYEIVRQRGR